MSLPLRNLRVSDHALLRYIERKKLLRQPMIDVEQCRADIMPTCPCTLAAIDQLGDGCYSIPGSHRIQVVNRVIVTVLPEEKDNYPLPKEKKPHFSNRKR